MKLPLVLLRGGGDLASGAAFRLFKAGFPVLITELKIPKMVRRTVCFGDAVISGRQVIENTEAVLIDNGNFSGVFERKHIGVIADENLECLNSLKPEIIADCRMTKKEAEDMRWAAPCVIGLGPGFCAGKNVDFVIETMRGMTLGQVIESGWPIPNTDTPGDVGGESIRRLIRAPRAGIFKSAGCIGDLVKEGQTVGFVGEEPVKVLISGLLRGLIADGLCVKEREKIGDVDPRGSQVNVLTISDKSRAVGGAVLEAAMRFVCGGWKRSSEALLPN